MIHAQEILNESDKEKRKALFAQYSKAGLAYTESTDYIDFVSQIDDALVHYMRDRAPSRKEKKLECYYMYCCDDIKNQTVYSKLDFESKRELSWLDLICDDDIRQQLMLSDNIYSSKKLSAECKEYIRQHLDNRDHIDISGVSELTVDHFYDLQLEMYTRNVGLLRDLFTSQLDAVYLSTDIMEDDIDVIAKEKKVSRELVLDKRRAAIALLYSMGFLGEVKVSKDIEYLVNSEQMRVLCEKLKHEYQTGACSPVIQQIMRLKLPTTDNVQLSNIINGILQVESSSPEKYKVLADNINQYINLEGLAAKKIETWDELKAAVMKVYRG